MSTNPLTDSQMPEIPPGIRRSQEAFWRELPVLLRSRNKGRWVAFHGDERVGFGASQAELYRACFRRGFRSNEVFVGRVEPHDVAPWEPIEIESSFGRIDEDVDLGPNEYST